MPFRRLTLAVLALALAAAPSPADESWTPVRAFRQFSKAQWRGLPQSTVLALAQDDRGVLWIGTFDGVATFDGRSLDPVADVPGAPVRGVITTIVPRPGGGVFAGSPSGVHAFDGRGWQLVPASRSVASLAVARDGALWMADVDGAAWTLDESAWRRRTEVGEPVVAMSAAPDGAVWLASRSGVWRALAGRAQRIGGTAWPGTPAAILAARDGRVWLATLAGTLHWTSGGGWQQVELPALAGRRFRSMAEDRRGRIWAGALEGDVVFGDVATGFRVWGRHNGPFGGGVMSLLGDREGSVWFGFNGTGLAQWIGESWSHRTSVGDPQDPGDRLGSWGITRGANGRDLLLAGFDWGFLHLGADGVTRRFEDAQGLTEDSRQAVEPEPGTYWVAGRFGVYESSGGRRFERTLALPSGFATGLFRAPDGRWFAATSTAGVYERAGGTWQQSPALTAGLDDPYVRGMTWTRDGHLWIGTLRGVSVFRDGRLVEKLTHTTHPGLPESVNAVVETSDGTIWAAGIGGIGVRRGGTWRRLTEADGLPGKTVYSLAVAPDGAVWAGGSGGVGRFKDGAWTTWDSRTGLLEDECNLNGLLVDDRGHVYAGTMGSLAHYDPGVPELPAAPLKLVWRETPAAGEDGRPYVADRELRVSWLAAWLGPRAVEYRVRMPRLREAWSEPTREDHVDVQNVDAGEWPVEVQARLEGTAAWTEPLKLVVVVPPYWYETIPARVAFVALVALLATAVVRLRVRALRRHAAQLEATVRQRTAELAEKIEQLSASEQRAQEASRAKSAFLANMSHELRTPLNGVLGFAQLLARRPGRDPEDRRQLGLILRSGEHLLGLINDVLSLARIEAGGAHLAPAVFDPRALVLGVVEMLRPRAEAKGLELRTDVAPAVPGAVETDPGKLRQVLLNLVGNAVKFTAKGHVAVRARWSDGRAVFEVEDSGPGIAPEEMAGLFAPFVQTEAGRAAREGTGLGLALSRELAELMGGALTATSERGRGSCFRLEIPLPAAAAEAGDDERVRVARLASGQPEWRLLVVDDVPENRELLTGLLRSVGFRVEEARSGEEAVEACRRLEPHLVWMDKRMGGIDGVEATRRIREEAAAAGRPPAKVIVVSASALAHEQEEILARGVDDFVAKPFREATVFGKLEEHLGAVFEREPLEPVAPAAAPPAAPGRWHVLVVDDQPINRELMRALLAESGIDVTEAGGGHEALSRLAQASYDAVLLDVEMPDLDGVATVRAIREQQRLRGLPVVAVTGHDSDAERARLAAAGMSDHLVKPVEPHELERVLARHLPAPGLRPQA